MHRQVNTTEVNAHFVTVPPHATSCYLLYSGSSDQRCTANTVGTPELLQMSFTENVACFVGTLYLFYFLLKCVKFVLEVLKTTFLGGNIDFRRFGEWAGTE